MEKIASSESKSTRNKSYYFESDKFVRDLVHGYVYLTKFDLDLISTSQFQRLRDIRQLTCQSVYPAARHTRFEHSLGVMELTRQVINNINTNGFISPTSVEHNVIINEQLQFNAALAALLHDIGHCPFSHLGESEFDAKEIWERLYKNVLEFEELSESDLILKFNDLDASDSKKPGAKHEQMSCIMILEKYKEILLDVKARKIALSSPTTDNLYVDFELLIHCILGIEYDTSTLEQFERNKEKNIIVNLINSKAFDMDKLDYVIRDSFFTSIGTPKIDTNRLFRNIFINNENEFKLVFKNRAVPVLQNFIEARDGLYMYVYNHHTAVFSDFMNSYIFRRLAHNTRDFVKLVESIVNAENTKRLEIGKEVILNDSQLKELLADFGDSITSLGMVSKEYLFSSYSIIDQNRSDSDLVSLLNTIHCSWKKEISIKKLEKSLDDMISNGLKAKNINLDYEELKSTDDIKVIENKLLENVQRAFRLIDQFQKHEYLKPWWKTNSEFNNFLSTNFKDDRICGKLCDWICQDSSSAPPSDEFRSQLAKNVIFITKNLYRDCNQGGVDCDLINPLEDGEFFVIQRSARFFDPQTISELDIALKSNEILGSPKNIKYSAGEFYIKSLTNVIPQRDYYSMYAKNSFYIFSKRLPEELENSEKRNKHYRLIEQIFIFVAKTLISEGVRKFRQNYCSSSSSQECQAHIDMYKRFKASLFV